MYLNDDAILIALFGLIGVAVLIFAVYAIREWRIERKVRRSRLHLGPVKTQTWNAYRGEWVADDDG